MSDRADQVAMIPDSLVAALRAVPMIVEKVWPDGADAEVPDYPALAAAARGWVRAQMPERKPVSAVPQWAENVLFAYNEALEDAARRLGL